MRAKLISTDPSLNLMFRLGAIETEPVGDRDSILKAFEDSIGDEGIALLILTKKVYEAIGEDVDYYRSQSTKPLIVVIDG
ncbi:V-type ATP synthase subunit F [Anaerococcus sp. AGMB09787]|uniref:V-type ATP synthase subunit F n=1 Tax=Anaerococcus sp. AGMB09787 TaxID=2922869 RepID=UPI0024342133|nr:V-type ATP synthase subunit F [Anaerococcus sp. AGMB09787]